MVRAIVAEVIDEIVDATVGEIPYVGWLLSPSVAWAIEKKVRAALLMARTAADG